MENKEIITEYIESVFEGIKDNAASVNQKIPVDSFRVVADNDSGEGLAAPHMKYIIKDQGSAPGKMRPVEVFYDFIVEENIQPAPRENKDGSFSKTTRESLAWAMAISQSLKGSLIYQGKKPGVDLKAVLKEKTPAFLAKLAKNIAASIATSLRHASIIVLVTVLLGSCASQKVKKSSRGIYVKENNKSMAGKTRMTNFYWCITTFSTLVFVHVMTQPE